MRLTALFALLMASALVGGVLVLERSVNASTDRSIRSELELRWEDLTEQIGSTQQVDATQLVDSADGPAQAYDARNGKLLDSTSSIRGQLLSKRLVIDATSRPRLLPHGADERYAVYVGVVGNGQTVVAIAVDVRSRDRAEDRLLRDIIIGAVAVFLLATLVAFLASRGTLAPVEQLRTQAARLVASEELGLLDVPRSNDELARLAQTFNNLLGRHHDTVHRERRFVADAGHELRTPIAAISAEAELALELDGSSVDQHAAFERIATTSRRLADLTERLLLLGGIRQDTLRMESFDLADVVKQAVDDWTNLHPDWRDATSLSIRRPARVHADAQLIELALINLLNNARIHGAAPLHITIATIGTQVELRVQDAGSGFADDFVATATHAFTRADTARTGEGTGLGLAIVGDVIRAHGGELTITSNAPALVRIRLPRE